MMMSPNPFGIIQNQSRRTIESMNETRGLQLEIGIVKKEQVNGELNDILVD